MGSETPDVTTETFMCRFALGRDFFGGDVEGDLGIAWTADNADAVAEKFQSMIDNGINFYLVEKTPGGSGRTKTTVTNVVGGDTLKTQLAAGKVFIKNADIKALIEAGVASLATLEGVGDFKVPTGQKAATGAEAATHDTVALGQRQGG